MYVLDASSIVKVCMERLPIPSSGATIPLALYESYNAIAVLVRRGFLDVQLEGIVVRNMADVFRRLKVLNIGLNEFQKIYKLARDLKLTVYDASYLYIAKELGYALITEDLELREKAKNIDVKAYDISSLLQI